jgi:hypothetical protein
VEEFKEGKSGSDSCNHAWTSTNSNYCNSKITPLTAFVLSIFHTGASKLSDGCADCEVEIIKIQHFLSI